ncbi:hypothetical protein [Haloglomus salinum]|uniref:hypothetical protein n=1 Tax=Haloglomus salinum TaxID=2962673 RepID=UPI0020C9D7C4|nr:hypothetical protein [Haloglomus salinum]
MGILAVTAEFTIGLIPKLISYVLVAMSMGARALGVTGLARYFRTQAKAVSDASIGLREFVAGIEQAINQPIAGVLNTPSPFGPLFEMIGGVALMLSGFGNLLKNLIIGIGETEFTIPLTGYEIKEISGLFDFVELILTPLKLFGAFVGATWGLVADFFLAFSGYTALQSILILIGLGIVIVQLLRVIQRTGGAATTGAATLGISFIIGIPALIGQIARDSLELFAYTLIGIVMMLYGGFPTFGSLLILGTGLVLAGYGLLANNGFIGASGMVVLYIGLGTLLAAVGYGFVGVLTLAALGLAAYFYAVNELLEDELTTAVTNDTDLVGRMLARVIG